MTAVDHISGHFRSIRNFFLNLNFFTKWRPALILDVRNSRSIAFLAILDRYTTLFFLDIFNKMAAVGHFECPKFTFDRISGHFRSIGNFNFFLKFFTKWPPAPILDVRNWLSIAFLAISDRYATLFFLEIIDKMTRVSHFGCPKFTFDRISGHFRSIHKLYFVWKCLTKWLPSAILDVRKSLLIAFLAISDRWRDETQPDRRWGDETQPHRRWRDETQPDPDERMRPNRTPDERMRPNRTPDERMRPNRTADEGMRPNRTADEVMRPNRTPDDMMRPNRTSDETQPDCRWRDETQPDLRWGDETQPDPRWEDETQPDCRWRDETQLTGPPMRPNRTADGGMRPNRTSDEGTRPNRTPDERMTQPDPRWEDETQPDPRWEDETQPDCRWRDVELQGLVMSYPVFDETTSPILAISDRYRIFLFFSAAIWMSENHFRLHFWPFLIDRPYWISEIHFRWHFWPFQIHTDLNYFFKLLMSENNFRSHFLPFQIDTQLSFSFFFWQNGRRRPF